jgi:hypothetical protein
MRKITVLVCMLMILLSSVCGAKPTEWKSQLYDFSKIKTVLFIGPFIEQEVEDQFAFQKTFDLLVVELGKRKIPVLFEQPLAESIGKELQVNMIELSKTDREKYLSLLREHGPKYVDAVLVANVQRLGYTQRYEEGYSIPYQTTQTSTFFGTTSRGNTYSGHINTPTTQYINVQGGNRDYTTAGYSMTLYDTNLNVIWGFSDIRSHRLTKLSKSGPEAVLKRIINTAFNKAPIPKVDEK